MSNEIIDMIIKLTNGAKNEDSCITIEDDGKEYKLSGARYLLNQMIRQYGVLPEHHYISEEAQKLWAEISDENIWNYVYTNSVKAKADIKLPNYVGSKNKSETVEYKKGESIKFNSIFHDDHIIPIKRIIDELCALEDLNEKTVKDTLDNIYLCRITKEEDRKLGRTTDRGLNFNENYEKIYKTKGVVLKEAVEEYNKRKNRSI